MKQNIDGSIRHGVQCSRWCLGIIVTLGAVACTPSPDPLQYTVDYFREHSDERAEKLTECVNDPGALKDTRECINARQAEVMEGGIGGLRKLPPMGLPQGDDVRGQIPKKQVPFN